MNPAAQAEGHHDDWSLGLPNEFGRLRPPMPRGLPPPSATESGLAGSTWMPGPGDGSPMCRSSISGTHESRHDCVGRRSRRTPPHRWPRSRQPPRDGQTLFPVPLRTQAWICLARPFAQPRCYLPASSVPSTSPDVVAGGHPLPRRSSAGPRRVYPPAPDSAPLPIAS